MKKLLFPLTIKKIVLILLCILGIRILFGLLNPWTENDEMLVRGECRVMGEMILGKETSPELLEDYCDCVLETLKSNYRDYKDAMDAMDRDESILDECKSNFKKNINEKKEREVVEENNVISEENNYGVKKEDVEHLQNDDEVVEKVEYKLNVIGGGYISFNKPIGCEEVKEEDLPASAPEGTLCMYFCNNDMIMFKVTRDFNIVKEDEINNRFINNYIRGVESSGEVEVIETKFIKINDALALKTRAKFLDMDFLIWYICEGYNRIEISAYIQESESKEFIEKIANSVSYSVLSRIESSKYIDELIRNRDIQLPKSD
jgi:hypothetical protein